MVGYPVICPAIIILMAGWTDEEDVVVFVAVVGWGNQALGIGANAHHA
jgi:hypothetical protein